MRLALLLLMLAALCSWASFRLKALAEGPSPSIGAERGQSLPPTLPPLPIRDSALETIAPGRALFRAAIIPAALQAPQPGEAFVLVGIAGRAGARVAFLRDEADQHAFRMREGESVREWVVEDLNERCAVLRRARRQQTVCLS